ncbi:NADPH-dependent ferric siderophore reductase, contains FAD-binding and SIP domains [Pseudomonas saponiphila]|uniref:NADPH-dependent ferric siderophore reductase, contains FAD-binding and SIP domains n=1 Tax=Pseudomonas saponiphila TaxID=556534 RepID=A0A1H4LGD8_9PSED|nr:siderophore-interacting protein [Pseudomonas saponiphila]SEB69829.1 NADPH-dependent ferric siderophore reductase, contains FAD-binding and SIP domains [Pseudomonas saponiphila]
MSSATSLASALAQGLRKLVGVGAQPPRGYRLINVELKQRIELSPSMLRLVFSGEDIAQARTLAPDQRIKLLFPGADGTPPQLPAQGDWQAARRQLPAEQQPPMRTYTIRALRLHPAELDVDFVLHGVNGPASAWATHARPGDCLQMVVPNKAYSGDPGGYEWLPPAGIGKVLLMGDETALPAIAGILEELQDYPDYPDVQVFIEVPHESDCIDLQCHPQTRLSWLPRDVLGAQHGEPLIHAARELAELPPASAGRRPLKVAEGDPEQRPWETAKPADNRFYAWVAGESATVMSIRRHLINERGQERRNLTLMGYWRLGGSLG